MQHLPISMALCLCAAAAAQWSPAPTNHPPADQDANLTYELLAARVLMLGTYSNETWSYDGAQWTQLHPLHSPPQNRRRSLVYDLARGRAVLYGGGPLGSSTNASNDDTFEWDGSDWVQVFPLATPGGLADYGAAYDLARVRTVVFGGTANVFFSQMLNSTYEYDGVTWTLATPGTVPPPRRLPAMAFATALGATVMFGGDDPQSSAFADTWLYDGATWTQVNTAHQPSARTGAHMVYDNQRAVCVLFGGRDPATLAILNDTWEFDGVDWTEIDAHVYPPRADFGMTMDLLRNRPVLFGGRIANNGVVDDTWEFGASYATFGLGCPGSQGRVALGGVQAPQLGGQCVVALSNLPPSSPIAVLVSGLSKTSWSFGTLPMLLEPFGMPGCRIYVRPDLLQILPASGGTAVWHWNTPNVPSLFGKTLYQQGLALDPTANAAGMIVSNAGAGVVGH